MEDTAHRAIAIVGMSAIMPDAPDAQSFWENIKGGRYSVSEVPAERWDPELYYDADPSAPGKTYSRIGGWVREWQWDPYRWRLPIPPKIADAMDEGQKWAVALAHAALRNHGEGGLPLDRERTAVVIGNAMGGEQAYMTSLRIYFPEFGRALAAAPSFLALPEDVRGTIENEIEARFTEGLPDCSEDTMPGELSNVMAGRVANLFNLKGPNFVCDAACASALAAIDAAVEGLVENEYDAVLTGGVDRNMGASSFVKFCKIGALSATGTRPYADGADGFVMGEGGAFFLLKRLADAERDGDRIYAVVRGVGGSSDGKGKGITAPNPVGQRLALQRAWDNAGLSPSTVGLLEGHGTSTRVGDVVEFESLNAVFGSNGLAPGSIALGSVKSNIGHLKSGAGAAGLFKAAMALHEKVLPPSLNFKSPNPNIDFSGSPIRVNTELRPWDEPDNGEGIRRAGVSAFGFGGTNFHAVLEEYVPGRLDAKRPALSRGVAGLAGTMSAGAPLQAAPRAPLQGALLLGADSKEALQAKLLQTLESGIMPVAGTVPAERDLRSRYRLAIAWQDESEFKARLKRAAQAFKADQHSVWKAMRAQGIFYGTGAAPKVAFLYTGQGSQYANMLAELRECEPIVAATFAEADRVMQPLIGRTLSELIFVDPNDSAATAAAEQELRRTEITQPAVLTVDMALTRLFASYGIEADMVIGHSLGEYGALVASGALPFEDALQAVSARGRGMAEVAEDDNGLMAAVFAPLEEIQQVVDATEGNVVIANINSNSQAVIGGASDAVQRAMAEFTRREVDVAQLPVSHAFHTSIVAAASGPLRESLGQTRMSPPVVPLVSNVTGEFYPMEAGVEPRMIEMLAQQVASPVQFVKGLDTLFQSGARVFLEVGPKKALQGFADDVLGHHEDVLTLFSNHPKTGEIGSFNQALCGLYSAGLGVGAAAESAAVPAHSAAATPATVSSSSAPAAALSPPSLAAAGSVATALPGDRYQQLGRMFAEFMERGWQVYRGGGDGAQAGFTAPVVTGAAIGLPGRERVFDDSNVQRILGGEQEIDVIPTRFRHAIVDKHITRLVKEGDGDPHFETISSTADVIKLAGRGGIVDLEQDYGVPGERVEALDITTQLAMAAGIDALRDAGIPLIMTYRTTHKGTKLPERWMLPEQLRDDTAVIFASAFPGYDSFADELTRYQEEHRREAQLEMLTTLRERLASSGSDLATAEIERQIHGLQEALQREPYTFNRRFLFRALPMGHSQMAEYIGARGPNTHINSACASSTQAFALAEDWIRAGRCRRVLVIAADDVTSDHLLEWIGSGFLASGAAATDEVVEEAALPFDRRRHGMIMGMGACGVVIERPDAAAERGLRPICEVLSTVTANSAFHGTRLNIDHICEVMEKVVAQAEQRFGIDRKAIAGELMFMSHETYTPARGGSASAEINALRTTFGDAADKIVIANTKGFTGHAMGVGIEDTVAIKALETGVVPPVANYHEQDPELGPLNLSRGGVYPVRYALRLGAGFGSQISMSLMRWVPSNDHTRQPVDQLGYDYRISDRPAWQNWLQQVGGVDAPQLEVVQRTLRVQASGLSGQPRASAAPAAQPAPARPAPAPAPAATAPVAPLAATPTPVAEVPPAAATDPVTEQVLAIVAEITGYPTEMLDPELDLEADLGIDTVKQAETFAAIRGQYDIPRDENLKLRDYPTIAAAVEFVRERRPDLPAAQPAAAAAAPAPVPTAPAAAPAASTDPVTEQVLAIVAEITGYPTEMLDTDLDLEADLGIDTVKQAETFAAIRGQYDIPRDENLKLRDYPTIAAAVQFVRERRPDLPAAQPAAAAPAPAPAAVATAPAAAPAAVSTDPVTEQVLAIVAEITGYPTEMLDTDLDLEADLGIDTVKQAETFAAIRGQYDIPRDENLKLRDYPTIAAAVQFVRERRPDLPAAQSAAVAAPAVAEAAPVPAAAAGATDPVIERVLAIVSEITGYPIEMLDTDLDLEADLGIDTVKQAETFAAIRGQYDIPRDENLKLRDYPTIASAAQFVRERRPDLPAAQPAAAAPAPAAVPTAPAAAPAAAAAGATDPVIEQVLAIVSEITGYPIEMLDTDLDLEADLGIDTVKQAETFAAIRGQYDIPRDENLKLRDYPTIASAAQFVRERRPDLAPGEPVAGAAPAAVEAAPDAAPDATPGGSTDPVTRQVMAIVSEITGYPTEMLDIDLDLEADLGIDTVKQAETFAAIRGQYDIPRDENLKLRDYPTIASAVQFVRERRPDLAETGSAAAAAPAAVPAGAAPETGGAVSSSLLAGDMAATMALPRRVPRAMLRPALELCRETGITLGEGSRVVVMPDSSGVAAALVKRLQKRQVQVLELAPDMSREQLVQQIESWLQDGPLHGLYWLPALDADQPVAQLDLTQWREQLELRVKLLYCAAKAMYEQLAGPDRFMLVATRLGGRHGYDEAGALGPMGGAVTGFAKAFARERTDVLVKAVDFAASRKTAGLADALIEETLLDAGAVEIGRCEDRRWGVGLVEEPAENGGEGLHLDGDSVFVITGAAGSIVSAITADLAIMGAGTFYLLDLAEEPDPADADVRRVVSDRDALKLDIFERLRTAGERATPAVVEKRLAALERSSAALSAIEALQAAGATPVYRQLDLTRPDDVAGVIDEIRERHGRIDVLLHAAGIEISHTLPDKSEREFDLVFDVKCEGWFNMLQAIDDMHVGAAVVFSSIAGRFGNLGQTDYSAANDLLCKSVSSLRQTRPATRGIAIDWTAWADIGMASRGSIPAMMAQAGIDMLAPGAGIPVIRHELGAGDWSGELVIAERLGILVEEPDGSGGLDVDALSGRITGPMIGRICGMSPYRGLRVETPLSPQEQPFLYDHQIDGTPVMPGVMAAEAFAELATLMFPSLQMNAVEDVEFQAPLKFYRGEQQTLDLTARFTAAGDAIVAHCQCASRRKLHGRDEEQVTTHFTAAIRLGDGPSQADPVTVPDVSGLPALGAQDLYQVYFHGPAYQVLDNAWSVADEAVGQLRLELPPNHRPEERELVLDPRLVELCLQTAGAWEIASTGRMSLPRRIRRIIPHAEPGQWDAAAYALVRPRAEANRFDARVVDESGRVLVELEDYESIEYPGAIEESRLAPFKAAMIITDDAG